MAHAKLSVGIDLVRGKLKRDSEVVMRMKEFRADDGTIIKEGPQELYFKEKRDYKRHPRKEMEAEQARKWTEACRTGKQIVENKDHPRYAELRARWNAQAKGQPDELLAPKRIATFPNFVRAILVRELTSE